MKIELTILFFRKIANFLNEVFFQKNFVHRENLYEKSELKAFAKYQQTHNWRTRLANCRQIIYLLNVRLFTVCSYFFLTWVVRLSQRYCRLIPFYLDMEYQYTQQTTILATNFVLPINNYTWMCGWLLAIFGIFRCKCVQMQ